MITIELPISLVKLLKKCSGIHCIVVYLCMFCKIRNNFIYIGLNPVLAESVLLLLSLSYHRRLRMILRSAWAAHWKAVGLVTVGVCVWLSWLWWDGWGQGWSWCLVGMRDKARWLVVCREIPEHFQSVWGIHWLHPIAPPSRCAVLGRVEPELVGLPGKA